MAGSRKSLALIIAVLFLGCLFFVNAARPLSSAKLEAMDNVIENIFDGLFVEAIKTGGPSSAGHGHKATTDEMLEENKTGGPSSGGHGHKATTGEMLEENKKSGPSPGQGN